MPSSFKDPSCGDDEYMCSNGIDCIPNRFLCDGIPNDCPDNEDENKENCPIVNGKQQPLQNKASIAKKCLLAELPMHYFMSDPARQA